MIESEGEYMRYKGEQKLTTKIIILVTIPIIVLGVVSMITAYRNQHKIGYELVKEELRAVANSAITECDLYVEGDYSYKDGVLKKGNTPMTDNFNIVDGMKRDSGVDITLFWQNKRVLTTLKDSSGKRIIGTKVKESVYKRIQNDTIYFDIDMNIEGEEYCGYYTPLRQESGEIVGIVFAGRQKQDVDATIMKTLYKLIAAISFLLVLVIIITIIVTKRIAKVLEHTVNNLEQVVNGELAVSLHEKALERRDEIGKMARSVKGLVSSFRGIISGLQDASRNMSACSGSFDVSFQNIADNLSVVNTAVEEIANSATSQADETLHANEKMESMGKGFDDTATSIRHLNESCNKMEKYSQTAKETLKELDKISEQTETAVQSIQEKTNQTNKSAQAIRTVTEFITQIAAQTNMLSLNASIEAARAGESGRGFAVVAEQIRELAEKSRESAEKIAVIVDELVQNSDMSVETMNDVSEAFHVQNMRLSNTKEMFTSLDSEIFNVTGAAEKINEDMKLLNGIKEDVLLAVENLAAIAEENAASTEETSSLMAELQETVNGCKEETKHLLELADGLEKGTKHFHWK